MELNYSNIDRVEDQIRSAATTPSDSRAVCLAVLDSLRAAVNRMRGATGDPTPETKEGQTYLATAILTNMHSVLKLSAEKLIQAKKVTDVSQRASFCG